MQWRPGGLHGHAAGAHTCRPVASQLTFVNNSNTVMAGYSDRLYFGVKVPDVSGVVVATVNDCAYLRVVDSRDA